MPVYNKLVRDNIPDIIRASGEVPVTHTLEDEAYLKALLAKLDEEITEFKAGYELAELADLQEVILALAKAIGSDSSALESVRAAKAAKNGTFEQKIFLEKVQ